MVEGMQEHGDRKGEPEGGVIPGNYTEGTLEDI